MWNPIWHQAITHSLMNGRAFGADKTVIFTIHSPVAGSKIRFCFSNRLGTVPYEIGEMTVRSGSTVLHVTQDRRQEFMIPTGGCTISDELELSVPEGSDLEIRLYYKNAVTDCNMIEEGATLLRGNQVSSGSCPMKKPLLAKILGAYNAIPSLETIEVYSESETGSIVAFGDSITAMSRWTKPLARRLEEAYHGRYVLLNSGIIGNCLLYEPQGIFGPVFGRKGSERFQRDVLEIPHLTAVILGLGVNDVSYYTEKTKHIINPDHFQREITRMTEQLRERGVRVIIQTITPRLGVSRVMGKYTSPMEEQRLLFNDWIRSADIFDYVFDAEEAVREIHNDGYYYAEALHQGDRLHPNAMGGRQLANAYDLEKLTGRTPA